MVFGIRYSLVIDTPKWPRRMPLRRMTRVQVWTFGFCVKLWRSQINDHCMYTLKEYIYILIYIYTYIYVYVYIYIKTYQSYLQIHQIVSKSPQGLFKKDSCQVFSCQHLWTSLSVVWDDQASIAVGSNCIVSNRTKSFKTLIALIKLFEASWLSTNSSRAKTVWTNVND